VIIPPFLAPYLLRAIALAAVLAALAGLYAWRVSVERDVGRAQVQGKWDAERAAQLADQVERGRQSAAETQRRLDRHQENQRAQDEELAAARAAVHAVGVVADRLRDQLAANGRTARAAAGNPATGGQCEAALAASDLHAQLFLESLSRSRALAQYADAARAAGLKCQRDYESLLTP
jgi:hypothetical protein